MAKSVAVVGLGKSGLSTVNFLLAHGVVPVVFDSREKPAGEADLDNGQSGAYHTKARALLDIHSARLLRLDDSRQTQTEKSEKCRSYRFLLPLCLFR